jgi:uncharacterized SAM-binding protein YcdF (DUF218 family)
VDFFIARKVLAALVLPPPGRCFSPSSGCCSSTVARPGGGRSPGWACLRCCCFRCPSFRTHYCAGPIRACRSILREAQAIVILGGGIRRAAPEYGGDTLGRLTLERVRYGARLARETKLPVLVTGGSVYGGSMPEAALMKHALENEFGVRVAWTETLSRDTDGNARQSAAILLPAGLRRVLLVGHGFDMPRATALFAAAGLQATPAPTVIVAERFEFESFAELLPAMSALQGSYYALYELLANAVRRARAVF